MYHVTTCVSFTSSSAYLVSEEASWEYWELLQSTWDDTGKWKIEKPQMCKFVEVILPPTFSKKDTSSYLSAPCFPNLRQVLESSQYHAKDAQYGCPKVGCIMFWTANHFQENSSNDNGCNEVNNAGDSYGQRDLPFSTSFNASR
jgi:hypothetical protein